MEQIANSELRAAISTMGAELHSLRDARSGQEYIWTGDPKWWGGHSPLLFPIVGGLWNGVCRIDGREISIPKHGILRKAPWRTVVREADHVRLQHVSTVGDFATFPFAFVIEADYRLTGYRLDVTLEVHNPGGADLWFQAGGHPALLLPDWDEAHPVDGFLRLDGDVRYVRRAGEQGCLEPACHPVPFNDEGLIPLSVATFAHEALIFPEYQVKSATLLNRHREPCVRVESDAPVWLFWNPQGQHSPFVCCEPWYGLCDPIGFDGSVADRHYINCLHAGESWHGHYAVEVLAKA